MDSSTWRRESSKPARTAGLLVAIIAVVPILWLTMLEVGYVSAYPACADGTNGWLHKPNAVFTALIALATFGAWWLYRRFRLASPPAGFLSGVALLITTLTLVVAIATVIPPLILQPCD